MRNPRSQLAEIVKKDHRERKSMKKLKCWEIFQCGETDCPAFHKKDLRCWLYSGTHCRNEVQGKFLEKMEMCLSCAVFTSNMDVTSMGKTLKVINKQFGEFRRIVTDRDTELENMGVEMALGLSEVFEALKKISSGDPEVRIPETSEIELISKLKHMVNITAENIGEIVDQSHEFAIGLAEHFDVLHRVSKADLDARVSGDSQIELLESLKNVTNKTIESIVKAEDDLRHSEEKYRTLTDYALVGIFRTNFQGEIFYVNEALLQMLEFESLEEFIPSGALIKYKDPADRKALIENLQKTGVVKDFEVELFTKTGKSRIVNMNAVLEGNIISGMMLDISERRKLEAQLIQAQKMEAVGTLAGGIAHDFNNILTAIISYAAIPLMKMDKDDPLRTYLDRILSSSEKAANLVHNLLAFSRKQIINPKPVDVNNIVRKVRNLLIRLIGEDIELKTRLTDKDLVVMADTGQIEQVLMNLATNARDAMPGSGTLSICTDMLILDKDFMKTHSYKEAGKYVLITVSDTGEGMDEETRGRIFEPFFTTKEVGKGTGLGLAMAYGIIKQHNGYITCYSEPERGTTFKIYLPLVKTDEDEDTDKPKVSDLRTGTETVLLAEDNADVRSSAKEMLAESGYKVIEAADGEDAIEKFVKQGNGDKIELLILDAIMPKKNGKETYEAIKEIRPDIKVLFSSGYPADIIHKKGILEERINFVLKPFSPYDFLRKVREVLDTRI